MQGREPKMTTIMIYEDNAKLRKSLCMLIAKAGYFNVVADFGNANTVDQDVQVYAPEIVIMDIDMPGRSGVNAVRIIKEQNPDVLILMYTVFEDEDKIYESLCAGANGYILKKAPPAKLVEAIRDLKEGGAPLTPSVARKVLYKFKEPTHNAYHLSEREKEILKLLIAGFSYQKIADSCFVAIDTIRSHIRNIYMKLHVNCGREAVVKALREKIV